MKLMIVLKYIDLHHRRRHQEEHLPQLFLQYLSAFTASFSGLFIPFTKHLIQQLSLF